MDIKTIVAIAVILAVLGAGYAVARPTNDGPWNSMMGNYGDNYGNMMRDYGRGLWHDMMGPSMMGGYGNGSGHCSGYGTPGSGYVANATPITIEKAGEAVEQYLASTGNEDLKLTEIMEFDNHFYAEVKEKSTGIHAFELLVNRYTGAITPEMGPNMMWNTRYGHMNWNVPAQGTVTEEQALESAQGYLDKALPGTRADEADAFYGYYTIHVLKDDKIYGMLSVNSNTGAVWYHNWHGEFVKMMEVE